MNKKIIIAVAIIGGSGVINAWTHNKPVSTVILGAYILLFVLALADMFGPPLSDIAGGIAMVAVVFVLLTEFPWQTILSTLRGGNQTAPIARGSTVGF